MNNENLLAVQIKLSEKELWIIRRLSVREMRDARVQLRYILHCFLFRQTDEIDRMLKDIEEMERE